jgi:hypothetical protein
LSLSATVLMGPGSNERTFEFCYNAEYCHINAALLATHPHIPSQNAEKDLGYRALGAMRRWRSSTSQAVGTMRLRRRT